MHHVNTCSLACPWFCFFFKRPAYELRGRFLTRLIDYLCRRRIGSEKGRAEFEAGVTFLFTYLWTGGFGEVGVQKSVIGREQFGDRQVVVDGMLKEMLHFANHIFAQSLPFVQRIALGIGSHEVDPIELQPGVRKLLQELIGF